MPRSRPYSRLIVLGLLSYLHGTLAIAQSPIQVDHADNQTIYFTTGTTSGPTETAPKSLKTGLFDLQYLGALHPTDNSVPYFLFAGDPCKSCTSERALYLVRPNGNSAPKVTSFVYPGKVYDPKTRALVLESRAFFGHCLAGSNGDDFYVVFQREHHVDRHHSTLSSVFVAQASTDFLHEKLIDRGTPSFKRTLKLVKSKICREIQGRSRTYELKPRGLNWRNMQPDDGDDDDDVRQNQTDQDLTPSQD